MHVSGYKTSDFFINNFYLLMRRMGCYLISQSNFLLINKQI